MRTDSATSSPGFRHAGLLLAVCLEALGVSLASADAAEIVAVDRAGNRVVAFDEATGKLLRTIASAGFAEPSGIALGSDGVAYVANLQGGPYPESPSASVVSVDLVSGVVEEFNNTIFGAGGIAYHAPSDTVFVSEFGNFNGEEVNRLTSTGTPIGTTPIGGGSAPTGRAGMAFDEAGNLYVSENNLFGAGGSVLKYDAAGDFTASTTFASGVGVQLSFPLPASGFNGLAFSQGTSGDLYVASLVGQAIVKFTVDGGAVVGGSQFGSPIPYPSGILFAPGGDLIASSLGNNNPNDQIYGNNLFPGTILRYHAATGAATPLLVGDVNRDAEVNLADLTALGGAFGVSPQGDLSGDFETDGADFLLWQQGLGNQGVVGAFLPTGIIRWEPNLATVALPEPAGLLLAAAAASGVVRRRPGRSLQQG